MDKDLALKRLRYAEHRIRARQPTVDRRDKYVRGVQDLPFAPNGVNAEYESLREMSIANWLELFVTAPVQRLRIDAMRTGMGAVGDVKVDDIVWRDVFQANKWDVRQNYVYESMMRHGRGIASVWPNAKNKEQPIVRSESFGQIHIEMDPDDPLTILWAAKVYEVDDLSTSQQDAFILPAGMMRRKTVGIVYTDTEMMRFERGGLAAIGSDWDPISGGEHPMREVPFALSDAKLTDAGEPWSGLDHMIPQQDALNTIRFNTLLAMQFSAFRQRVVTGFDPRVFDEHGNVQYRTDTDGKMLLGPDGQPLPILNSPGKIGVDRLLAFSGADTKVFDLPESNLKNYIEVHENFLVNFFATGQIPPQYLLSRMSNLSGDALAGAESTFKSLIGDLQLAAGEGNEQIGKLSWYARGEDTEWNPSAECQWADAEARSFSQIVDALVKLIQVGFPKRSAFEMIPGATTQKVDRWMEAAKEDAFDTRVAGIMRNIRQPAPTAQPAAGPQDE